MKSVRCVRAENSVFAKEFVNDGYAEAKWLRSCGIDDVHFHAAFTRNSLRPALTERMFR